MKHALFFILVIFILSSCGESSDKPNVLKTVPKKDPIDSSALELRLGITYLAKTNKMFTGDAKKIYKNGQVASLSTYKNGKLDGLLTSWYPNGQKEVESNFKNGKQHGLTRSWRKDGEKLAEVNFKHGINHGLWTDWYKNGQKMSEKNLKDGKLISCESWKPDGKKCPETNLKNGNGVSVSYHLNGNKRIEVNYKNGMQHGLWTIWNKDGKKWRESNWIEGKRVEN